MPIQFRCQYCRQRLGIADSRAGAVVDCPACGRTLRVPGRDDGAAGAQGTSARPEADPQLQSALQLLSAIGPGTPAETPPATIPIASVHKVVPRKAANVPVAPGKHAPTGADAATVASADPLKELAALPVAAVEDLPLLAEPELIEDTAGAAEVPAEAANKATAETPAVALFDPNAAPLAAALAELAAQPHPVPLAPPRSTLQRTFPILIPLLTGLLMFTAGYLTGRSGKSGSSDQPAVQSQPAAVPDTTTPPESVAPQPVAAGQISGIVQATGADGKTTPDAGALVIIAPADNPSELRIDGRFLRDAPDTPGRLAITAALAQLGVSFTHTAADGTFSLPLSSPGPGLLIVVSRRNVRPAAAPLPADVAAGLSEWFTAPSPVTGRLQTVVQNITAPGDGSGVRQNVTIPAM